MFDFFYLLSIKIYSILICVSALFNNKAKLFLKGRKNIFNKIKSVYKKDKFTIWIHSSSLGEFEQARPLIEKIKKQHPDYQIFVTFFSPSGYEIRKNYKFADYIFYLPIDTHKNAKKFLDLIQPNIAIFVKYDFWYFYLKELHRKKVETYLISGIFREKQIFFKKIGKSYSKVLTFFTHIFVQDEKSAELLKKINITNVSITGDTRFDRVIEIAESNAEISIIDKFKNGKICVIAGSSWQADEKLLVKYINQADNNVKFIIAPHEIDEAHINILMSQIEKKVERFSKITEISENTQVLIIDTIGILAKAYRYGEIAYIGGGFGAGIHNIVEAAVYGMPVIFGPNYKKFKEAIDLIQLGVAFPISSYEELKKLLDKFIDNRAKLIEASTIAKNYVLSNKGATDKILNRILDNKKQRK